VLKQTGAFDAKTQTW